MLGTFLSLTYYFQGTLHYSALKSGFAFVPFSLGIITGATPGQPVPPPLRAPEPPDPVRPAGGLWLGCSSSAHAGRASCRRSDVVLPAEVIVSLGMGLSFVGHEPHRLSSGWSQSDAGVASALVNSTQQTGGTLGAAFINTIATTATVSPYVAGHGKRSASLTAGSIHGYTTAFTFSAIVLAVAAVTDIHA